MSWLQNWEGKIKNKQVTLTHYVGKLYVVLTSEIEGVALIVGLVGDDEADVGVRAVLRTF